MDEIWVASDARLLLTLLGCGFVLILVWVMDGIASLERAQNAEPEVAATPGFADRPAPQRFDAADRCMEPIGRYMDSTIYETVSIGGLEYHYDHVLAPGGRWLPEQGERCIAPGLVYVGH
jgi:hypothetical protein